MARANPQKPRVAQTRAVRRPNMDLTFIINNGLQKKAFKGHSEPSAGSSYDGIKRGRYVSKVKVIIS